MNTAIIQDLSDNEQIIVLNAIGTRVQNPVPVFQRGYSFYHLPD